jgi:long-chain fatty acid transport protein
MAALGLALFATAAQATNGMRMIGFGPVQDAMGGVSAAAPLDATTVVSNPAGMTALGRRTDIAGTFFNPTVKYDASGAASGNTMSSDRAASYIPTLALVWPSSDRLTVGIAAIGVSGMGVDYKADLYGGSTLTSYMNMRIAPAAAYRVSDQLSIGVSANLMYAQMKYAVAGGMGMLPRDTAGAAGFGATVGLQYRPFDFLTLGAAYETKSWFQDFAFDIGQQTLQTQQGPFPTQGGTEKLDFDQPQVATIGAAVRPFESLLVAADVEWINWSQTNGKNMPAFSTAQTMTGYLPWNMNWDDQIVLKVGAEYAATKELKVRAGYNYGKSPLDASRAFENIAFPAIAEHHFTAGVGYEMGTLAVNVAAMYSPESKLAGSNPDQFIPSYETKMSQLAFDLGVAYRF